MRKETVKEENAMRVSYAALGRNIRKARKEKRLTQAQMAEHMGISLLHYGRLERGERPVSLEQIAQAADILAYPVFSLLRGCFPENMQEADGMASCDADSRIGEAICACTQEEKEVLLKINRMIVDVMLKKR